MLLLKCKMATRQLVVEHGNYFKKIIQYLAEDVFCYDSLWLIPRINCNIIKNFENTNCIDISYVNYVNGRSTNEIRAVNHFNIYESKCGKWL